MMSESPSSVFVSSLHVKPPKMKTEDTRGQNGLFATSPPTFEISAGTYVNAAGEEYVSSLCVFGRSCALFSLVVKNTIYLLLSAFRGRSSSRAVVVNVIYYSYLYCLCTLRCLGWEASPAAQTRDTAPSGYCFAACGTEETLHLQHPLS